MILNEMEELAWRMAGQLDQKDISTLETMFSIGRNKDSFDREYYENDMASMSQFIEKANSYDDRVKLLEEWLARKEDEIKSRIVRPGPSMKKPDQ